jgi:hypothetical protein
MYYFISNNIFRENYHINKLLLIILSSTVIIFKLLYKQLSAILEYNQKSFKNDQYRHNR